MVWDSERCQTLVATFTLCMRDSNSSRRGWGGGVLCIEKDTTKCDPLAAVELWL